MADALFSTDFDPVLEATAKTTYVCELILAFINGHEPERTEDEFTEISELCTLIKGYKDPLGMLREEIRELNLRRVWSEYWSRLMVVQYDVFKEDHDELSRLLNKSPTLPDEGSAAISQVENSNPFTVSELSSYLKVSHMRLLNNRNVFTVFQDTLKASEGEDKAQLFISAFPPKDLFTLPRGWHRAQTGIGAVYYYTSSGITQWQRPTKPADEPALAPPPRRKIKEPRNLKLI